MRWIGLAIAVAACGSNESKTGATGGGDSAFVVRDQVAQRNRTMGDHIILQLVSIPGVCKLYQTGAPTTTTDYDIVTFELHDNANAITAGAKTTAAHQVIAAYAGNRKCNTRYGGKGEGTLTITALDDKHVAGTYDFTFSGWPFGGGGAFKGSFDAPFCEIDPNKLAYIKCGS